MKIPVRPGQPGRDGPRRIVTSNNGFSVEVCQHLESLRTAFNLRYQAYLQVGSIASNPQERLSDDYDYAPHSRTHLVWYEGQAVATVRSCIHADVYDWQTTEAREYFRKDLEAAIGKQVPFLESNRFAVSPNFQGRQSLFAQLLLFQMHAINTAAHQIEHIVTSVRAHHVRFYERFLGMKVISTGDRHVAWAKADVALMCTKRDHCLAIALQKGMPSFDEEDIQRYRSYAGLYV